MSKMARMEDLHVSHAKLYQVTRERAPIFEIPDCCCLFQRVAHTNIEWQYIQ
jgi:hypothetical protein